MAIITFDAEQLDALGTKLGSFDDQFTDEERALVQGLLIRGLAAVRDDDADVSGFLIGLLLPAVQMARESARRSVGDPHIGSLQVNTGDGSVMPAGQATLNFTTGF